MLIKRTEREKHRGSFAAFASDSNKHLDRRAFLRRSGLAAGGLAALGRYAARERAQSEGRSAARAGRCGHHPQEHLYALRRWLHGYCGSIQWRMDRPGAELGQSDQSGLALRQGRFGARAGAQRAPAKISDEARQRPVDPHQMGSGHR